MTSRPRRERDLKLIGAEKGRQIGRCLRTLREVVEEIILCALCAGRIEVVEERNFWILVWERVFERCGDNPVITRQKSEE